MANDKNERLDTSRKSPLRVSLSVAAVAMTQFWTVAHAADSTGLDTSVGTAEGGADIAAGSSPSADAGDDVQEITVTAQRRSERLTDVPITIGVASGAQLQAAGITDTADLPVVTPGLRMDRLGVYLQPSIRGVTAASTAPGAEANVSLYVDGIYQPNQAANNIDLPDTERVEVLKGPQGTLFGRNSTGGAIQVFTRDPSFTPTGNLTVGYGRFNDYLANGFVSAPLIDQKLAFSLTGQYEHNDGWIRDLLTGNVGGKVESRLVRGKLLFQPTDDLKFILTSHYSDKIDDSLFDFAALNGNTSAKLPGVPLATQPWTSSVNWPSGLEVTDWSISLRGSLELNQIGTITNLVGFHRTNIYISADGDAGPAQLVSFVTFAPDKNFTEDLNFASEKFGPLSFVAGLFYYRDNSGYDYAVGYAGSAQFLIPSKETVTASAAYLEGTWDVTSKLAATVGVRYSHEYRTAQYTGGLSALISGTDVHSHTWNEPTPRASLRYEIAPRSNIYATYSQGFKSGVYDLNSFATTPVNPEKVNSYEIGYKTSNQLFDLNVSAFLLNYSNLQVQYSTALFDALQNAGSARNYGVDADGTVRISKDLNLTAGLEYLHARYSHYYPASALVPIIGPTGALVGGNAVDSNADLSGHQVTRSPTWTATLAVNYKRDFSFGTLGGAGNMYYTDDAPLEPSGRVRQPSYALFNARLWYQPPGSGFRFTAWGRNLTNRAVIQSAYITTGGDGLSYAPPRTYGGSIEYSF